MTDTSTMGDVEARADVELRLPADGAYAALLRTVSAGLAARLDFTIDDIEDLRIAVSEACSLVLEQSDPGSDLDCRFRMEPGRLVVVISTGAAEPDAPDYESFGWQVLATLAAEAAIESAPGSFAVRLAVVSSIAEPQPTLTPVAGI